MTSISLLIQVKTQQGVPSQPANLRVVESRATSVSLSWDPPVHSGENILSYEIYWNDTFTTGVSLSVYLEHSYLNW